MLLQSLVVAVGVVAQTAAGSACPGPASASNPQTADGVTFKVLLNDLGRPRGVVLDSESNLLIVEANGHGVRRVVLDGADGMDLCVSSSSQLISEKTVTFSLATCREPELN